MFIDNSAKKRKDLYLAIAGTTLVAATAVAPLFTHQSTSARAELVQYQKHKKPTDDIMVTVRDDGSLHATTLGKSYLLEKSTLDVFKGERTFDHMYKRLNPGCKPSPSTYDFFRSIYTEQERLLKLSPKTAYIFSREPNPTITGVIRAEKPYLIPKHLGSC